MAVYFLVPDYDPPSWGVGMIYHLTRMSTDLGLEAYILRLNDMLDTPAWLDIEVKQKSIRVIANSIAYDDLVIVPEIMVDETSIQTLSCRKIVFIQGGFLIPLGLNKIISYQDLGFEMAIANMPHIDRILKLFWPIKTFLIQPFIADYFFPINELKSIDKRGRRILLFPKEGYQRAGYYDYQILFKVLKENLIRINSTEKYGDPRWTIVEAKNYSHRELASLMQDSCFFINTNCFESLNATVAESMASGCIPFCYEAFGGQDYLKNEYNAFVFHNNYIYNLLEDLLSIIENFDFNIPKLLKIQRNGRLTASHYTRTETQLNLENFYREIGLIK